MTQKNNYTVIEGVEKPKLIISTEALADISFLHAVVGATEWSGVLLLSIDSGNITDPANLVLRANRVWAINIGSAAYTEFEYDEAMLDMYDAIPDATTMKEAKVHTHHNMSVGFSTTDYDDLYDNCKHYNYYISLIVKFNMDFECKIAIPAKKKLTSCFTIKGDDGSEKEIMLEEKDVILTYNVNVVFEHESAYVRQYNKMMEAKKKADEESKKRIPAYTPPAYNPNNTKYPFQNGEKNSPSTTTTDKTYLVDTEELEGLLSQVITLDFSYVKPLKKAIESDVFSKIGNEIKYFDLIKGAFNNILDLDYPIQNYKRDVILMRLMFIIGDLRKDYKDNSSKAGKRANKIIENVTKAIQEIRTERESESKPIKVN